MFSCIVPFFSLTLFFFFLLLFFPLQSTLYVSLNTNTYELQILVVQRTMYILAATEYVNINIRQYVAILFHSTAMCICFHRTYDKSKRKNSIEISIRYAQKWQQLFLCNFKRSSEPSKLKVNHVVTFGDTLANNDKLKIHTVTIFIHSILFAFRWIRYTTDDTILF